VEVVLALHCSASKAITSLPGDYKEITGEVGIPQALRRAHQ